jgi:hypothetical protein
LQRVLSAHQREILQLQPLFAEPISKRYWNRSARDTMLGLCARRLGERSEAVNGCLAASGNSQAPEDLCQLSMDPRVPEVNAVSALGAHTRAIAATVRLLA